MYVHTHTHTYVYMYIPTYVCTYVLEPGTDYVVHYTTNTVGQLTAVTSVPQELNFPTITRC